MRSLKQWLFFTFAFFLIGSLQAAPPSSFPAAKYQSRTHIYHDRYDSNLGTIYCGCEWEWTTRTGGATNLASCGYEVRRNDMRAHRTEWEHIVPAWNFGHQRQCWQNGGRKNCESNDPIFKRMEADLHNLSVAIGEVNGDRSNYRFGMVSGGNHMYGACESKTDFDNKIFEPRDKVKGMVARVTFYMADRYKLRLSKRDQRIYMVWDKQFPPDSWEIERDNRIARIMGWHNPFVTGEKHWTLGYKPEGAGLMGEPQAPSSAATEDTSASADGRIIGNKNSHIYHLPKGCPSYSKVAEHNRAYFSSETGAKKAGFRKASNCR